MIKRFFLDRLDERSTWRALVALLTLLGLGLSPEQKDAIIAAGVAIGAALEVLLPDPGGRIHPERLSERTDPKRLPDRAGNESRSEPADDNSAHDDAFGAWRDHS